MIPTLVVFLRSVSVITAPLAKVLFQISGVVLALMFAGFALNFFYRAVVAVLVSCKFEFKSDPVFASIMALVGIFCWSGLVIMIAG